MTNDLKSKCFKTLLLEIAASLKTKVSNNTGNKLDMNNEITLLFAMGSGFGFSDKDEKVASDHKNSLEQIQLEVEHASKVHNHILISCSCTSIAFCQNLPSSDHYRYLTSGVYWRAISW